MHLQQEEVPVMVEDIRAAARRIAANCRGARLRDEICPNNCPALCACSLAGFRPAKEAEEVRRLESLRH